MHLQLLECFLISPGFRNHIEIRLTRKQCPNTFANEDMIINDDDVDQTVAPKMPTASPGMAQPIGEYIEKYARILG